MARRSSARLRNQNLATPQRVSLSHDVDAAVTRTTQTLPSKLASLNESDEMPGAFPDSPTNAAAAETTAPPKNIPPAQLATPTNGTAIKPAAEEMHPQRHHQTTAKPRDEARYLGFSNFAPHTEPPMNTGRIATLQATPTKSRDLNEDTKSPSYQFTFRREYSLELSPQAKRLMIEKRDEAAKIREQMVANGEAMSSVDQVLQSRRIAKPKGRFSQAHSKEFDRMESIAVRPSAIRARTMTNSAPSTEDPTVVKSLKRKTSKAGFDQSSSVPSSRPSPCGDSLPALSNNEVSHATSIKDNSQRAIGKSCPSVKRVKRTETDDVSTTRSSKNVGEKLLPSSPQCTHDPQFAKLSNLTTPTQASLARTADLKSNKGSKIPGPSFSPIKATPTRVQTWQSQANRASPALLARSPTKSVMGAKTVSEKAVGGSKSGVGSALLAQTPLKKPFPTKSAEAQNSSTALEVKSPALLSRFPVKAAMPKRPEDHRVEEIASSTPFLARSPSKFAMTGQLNGSSGQSWSTECLGRVNLLRQTPIKSILRSPQRLYSDDPAKVAAGTHFATPPKIVSDSNRALTTLLPATAPVQKHVDFTSSTKAREAKAQSGTPSKALKALPKADRAASVSNVVESISYPDLPGDVSLLSPSPQKRRQTSGPGDFTFRAGEQNIVFGSQVPMSSRTMSGDPPPSTIRVVSADHASSIAHAAGRKKRKFDFENTAANAAQYEAAGMSDKENAAESVHKDNDNEEEEQRPTKRVKPSSSAQKSPSLTTLKQAPSSAVRRNTLGVRAKGSKTTSPIKRSGTISQARLNALSQPKRR